MWWFKGWFNRILFQYQVPVMAVHFSAVTGCAWFELPGFKNPADTAASAVSPGASAIHRQDQR